MWKIRNKVPTQVSQINPNGKTKQEDVNTPIIVKPNKKFDYKVCICGVARNVEPFFKKTIENLLKIYYLFSECKLIIVESDSQDRSVELLSKVEQVELFSMGKLQETMQSREERIAYCRNVYVKKVLDSYSNFDIMIVIDLDDVLNEEFDINIFNSCLSQEKYPEWDAVFANQSYRYYDIWALRNSEVNYDCWDKINSKELTKIDAIMKHQVHIPKNSNIIPVISAFGGLGIYKIKNLDENSKYIGVSDETKSKTICEHVSFNTYLSSKGCKLFIDPELVLETPVSFAKYYV